MGIGGPFPGIKLPEREADHLNLVPRLRMLGYTSTALCLHGVVLSYVKDVFMAWYLVKHRDNFTYTFTFNCCMSEI
jgi:hypothetical protein